MKGFTLIETMVAVTILTIAVAGPMVTAGRAIVAAQISRDQLTASYLAQEGVEYVRAIRDDEYLATYPSNTSAAWGNFLTGVINQCRAPNICTLALDLTLVQCPNNSCTTTFSLLSNGTPYKRTIQVIDASPGGTTDIRIISRVLWDFHGKTYSVTVYDHLTSWQ